MKSYQDASLGNVVLGIASLAILYVLINRARPEGGVFWNIGYFKPINQVKNFLFVKPALILRSARETILSWVVGWASRYSYEILRNRIGKWKQSKNE